MELRLSCTNPSIWVPNLVITAFAADLTLHGAQPSAGTVLTTKMDRFYSESRWLWLPFRHRVTSFKMAEEILGNLPALWVLKPTKSTVEPCIPYHNQSLLHTHIIIVFKTCFMCHIIMLGKRGLNSLGKWSRNNSFSYYPGLSIISPIHCSLWRVSLCGSRAPCGMSQHWSLGSPICCQTYISPLEWDLVNSPSKLRHASCRWTGMSMILLHLQIPTFNDTTNWNTNNHFQLSSMKFIAHLQYVFIVDFCGGVAGMYVITSGDHHYRPLPAYCGQWVVLMANWPPQLVCPQKPACHNSPSPAIRRRPGLLQGAHMSPSIDGSYSPVSRVCPLVITWFSSQYSQETPHSSPVRAKYGVPLVSNYIVGSHCNILIIYVTLVCCVIFIYDLSHICCSDVQCNVIFYWQSCNVTSLYIVMTTDE